MYEPKVGRGDRARRPAFLDQKTALDASRNRADKSIIVGEDVTSGDYLHGFLHGTRDALYEKGRRSIAVTLDELNARSVGVLIALLERAVGVYAELIDVNAYD